MRIGQNRWDGKTWETKHELGDRADLLLYFASRDLMESPQHFEELRRQYPKAAIVGCSTGGEILGKNVGDESLVTTALQFEDTQIRLAKTTIQEAGNAFDGGKKLGGDLKDPNLASILVFSDGTQVNGSDLVRGLIAQVGKDIPITGGLAGDGARFEDTYVSANDVPQQGLLVAIGFYGKSIQVGHGSVGGWETFGPERTITRASGNVLYELDGQPALDLYKKYLGDEAANLPSSALLFPLSIRPSDKKGVSLVRTILSIDEKEKSMIFAGDVPEGFVAQLMRGNVDSLVEGASKAAKSSQISNPEGDQLAILVSCIGRKLLMGQYVDDEVEAVGGVLGNQTKLIGFYSYGEISPHAASGCCELHNQTMTITTLSEKKTA